MCAVDPYADDFKRFAAAVPVVTYAINDKSADVSVEKVVLNLWESEIIINTPIGRLRIITPLIGRNNVYNVLAAVATGLSINIPLKVNIHDTARCDMDATSANWGVMQTTSLRYCM